MQASVSGEVRFRIELYEKSFDFCRQGRFSYARFLALVPDRLRLAFGDGLARMRVPVGVSRALQDSLRAVLLDERAMPAVSGPLDPREMRRVIRIAQVDPELDPITLAGWLRGPGEVLFRDLGEVYRGALGFVGQGASGEDTAYLVHLVLLEHVRRILAEGARHGPTTTSALSATMIDLALRTLAESNALDESELPLRLGLKFAAMTSPVVLGASPEAMAARPANAYRTVPVALGLARRVLIDPVEVIPLAQVERTLAERLLVDPETRSLLVRETHLEMVRDCALLVLAQSAGKVDDLTPLRRVAGSVESLRQCVSNQRRRKALLAWCATAERANSRALPTLVRLLESADQVATGDPRPLGVHGDVDERAALAARGAIAMALDEHVDGLRRQVWSFVEEVSPEVLEAEHRVGRCYAIGLKDEPLFRAPRGYGEGVLFVSFRRFLVNTAGLDARGLSERLWQSGYRQVFELCSKRASGGHQGIELALATDEALVYRGDLVTLVELATDLSGVLEAQTNATTAAAPEVVGGGSDALSEAAEERRRLLDRLAALEAMLAEASEDEESHRIIADERDLVAEHLALLEEATELKRAREEGRSAAPVVFVGYGEVAEEIPLPLNDGVRRSLLVTPMFEEARGVVAWIDHGCVMSSVALDAFRTATEGRLRSEEHSVDLVARPSTAADPHDVVVLRRSLDGAPAVVLHRSAAEGDASPWKLRSPGSSLAKLLLSSMTPEE